MSSRTARPFHSPAAVARWVAAGLTGWVLLAGVLSAQAQGTRAKAPARPAAKPKEAGEAVWKRMCAGCHGAQGEGAKGYPKPLTGTRSVGELAKFIGQTMPPGPKKATTAEAQTVAAYVHGAFYSPVAQARNRPPRVDLSRLTVRQYRNALADLIASFRPPARWDERRGLRGVYFRGRGFRGNERVVERVDPEVRFDFGAGGPTPDGQYDTHKFSIRWEGSVVAPETGDYEFIVRTDHATRLWVNDLRRPLIDAGVKSGSDTEYRGGRFLIAGRAYPLRLEFTKSSQGVDDSNKLMGKPAPPAFVALEWKLPRRASEVIPSRHLLPATLPESFVAGTPFPPDDRSMGFERGTSVSKEWAEATTEGALETAAYLTDNLRELSGVGDQAPDRPARLKEFAGRFVERAFRRPLTPELRATYVDRHFQAAGDAETALKRVVLLALKSPRFLYRELDGTAADAYDVASRLAFGLWDSLPDAELLRAAGAGELGTREQVARQAERMLADPRARAKIRDFLLLWLKVDQHPDLAKDPKRFPGFDDHAASDLRTSLELFLDEVVWSEKSDYRDLLLSDRVHLNGRLAKLYGVTLPPDAPFQPVVLDASRRAGVLTHPYLMTSFAYLDASSPIHRGVLLARNMLGRLLQPPQEAFTPLPADQHPNLTTRQRVALQTKPAACGSCHDMINPLGFTLENFDAIGRFRTAEDGKPVDATGAYLARGGQTVRFTGARDLATFLAGSDEAHGAFVEKLFLNLVKQPVGAYGPNAQLDLERAFKANQFSIRRQVIESVALAAFPPKAGA